MIYLFSLQLLFFVTFIFMITIKYGVLPSISDSYYYVNPKGILFLFFCWILGLSMMISPLGNQFLFFLSGAGLLFTGISSEFRSERKTTRDIHNVSAVVTLLSLFAGQIIYFQVWWPLILTLLFITVSFSLKIKNKIWWVEVVYISLILIGFITNELK